MRTACPQILYTIVSYLGSRYQCPGFSTKRLDALLLVHATFGNIVYFPLGKKDMRMGNIVYYLIENAGFPYKFCLVIYRRLGGS